MDLSLDGPDSGTHCRRLMYGLPRGNARRQSWGPVPRGLLRRVPVYATVGPHGSRSRRAHDRRQARRTLVGSMGPTSLATGAPFPSPLLCYALPVRVCVPWGGSSLSTWIPGSNGTPLPWGRKSRLATHRGVSPGVEVGLWQAPVLQVAHHYVVYCD